MRDDETLEELLDKLRAQNAETLRIFAEADLDTPVPVPHDVPWFPQDIDYWKVRWVALHLVEELTRHAGHCDIIRESVDGATMYELMAGIEGWPETDWIKRWNRPRCSARGRRRRIRRQRRNVRCKPEAGRLSAVTSSCSTKTSATPPTRRFC